MAGNDTTYQRRLHRAGVIILIAGLLAAVSAYLWVPADDTSGVLGYEVVGGRSYPVMAADSKSTQYEIEKVGGKSVNLEVEFDQWFLGQWRGPNLSRTLFILSVGGALVCFGLARFLVYTPPPEGPNPRPE
jgi:hypothetical protein